MDPFRDMSQTGPENPGLLTENAMSDCQFDRYFDFDSYYGSAQPFLDEQSLSSSHTGWPTSPASHLTFPSHADYSSSLTDFSSAWDQEDLIARVNEMKRRLGSEDDGVSVSGSFGPSPPALVRGGSTSPSEHSSPSYYSDHSGGSPHQSSVTRIHDEDWPLRSRESSRAPKSPPHGYARPSHHGHSHHARKHVEDPSAGLKRRRSGDGLEKRPRHLLDPSQTADVRKSGACLPCRVSKTRCHENGVCPTCRQAFPDHSALVCLRITPSGVYPMASRVPDIWSKYAREEAAFLSRPRFFLGTPRKIAIFFSSNSAAAPLSAIVQAYQSNREEGTAGLKTASFPNEKMPLHPELQKWVEAQMRLEHKVDFVHALQSFICAYAEDGHGLPRHHLISKVHKLNCFFKIWKTSDYVCRDPSNKHVHLPPSVQAQLREIARKAVYQYEMDVLKELDDCLAQQSAPKPQERLATWAAMWQLMLIYKELLSSFRKYLERCQPASAGEYEYNCRVFRKLSDLVFPMIATFYHYQFRTKKSIEVSLDCLKGSSVPRRARESRALHGYGQQMLNTRKDMLHKLQASKSRTDAQFCVFVVDHELKKLNARKRNPKAC